MDAKVVSGTTKCQKDSVPPKKLFELHIKLDGVHDNPLGTVAGSFASRPETHSFVDFFFFRLIQEKQVVSYW